MARPFNIPQSLEAMLAEKLQTALTTHLITNVDLNDQSIADYVIIGKPTAELKSRIVVSIHTQHPFGPTTDKDTSISGLSSGGRPFYFPKETFGGMETEEMIGCVQINIREKMPAEEAVWINSIVTHRVKKAINEDSELDAFSDGLGNSMSMIETFRAVGYASGGDKVSVYFRWVDWRAIVHRSNCRLTV